MNPIFSKAVASAMVVCMLGVAAPIQAGIMPTTSTQSTPATQAERARVVQFLQRDDVRQQLVANGVDPQEAVDRVAALSDDEARDMAGRVDHMPAGGDILGIVFTVFIILLITDILGLTKVFPFTRSIRR